MVWNEEICRFLILFFEGGFKAAPAVNAEDGEGGVLCGFGKSEENDPKYTFGVCADG